MEIELLRTFIEVQRLRSFARAAENLALTPSAVSARIRQLERETGKALFTRSSQQVQLTGAGERLLRHAKGILDAWERARVDVGQMERQQVAVAGVASFWDIFLQQWINKVRVRLPEVAPWVEVSTGARVAEKLQQGAIQLGYLYSPPRLAEIVLRELEPMKLVMVASEPCTAEEALRRGYILVDWGTPFSGAHNRRYPARPPAAARSNSGRVALEMIHACGGAAYLPLTLIESELASGRLHRVEDAASFEMRVYAAYATDGPQREIVERMLACL